MKTYQLSRIDFLERRLLDYFLLIAIRAEICLRSELQASGQLASIPAKNQEMDLYIRELGKHRVSTVALGIFENQNKALTRLHDTPNDIIQKIMTIPPSSSPSDDCFISASLCCVLARNYFAHHDYMDSKLLNDKESQFLLGGILVMVLTLLS